MKNKNDAIDDKIFDFVYTIAMRDATLQKAYPGNKGEKKALAKNYPMAKNQVKEFVNNILDGKYKKIGKRDEYDKDFCELALNVTEILPPKFTLGNAQKLINMTIKYFYIMTYHNPKLRGNFVNCHCPMDSQLIKTVRKQYCKKNKKRKWPALPSGTRWSQVQDLKGGVYKVFQDEIRKFCDEQNNECLNPIEYDYKNWNNDSIFSGDVGGDD